MPRNANTPPALTVTATVTAHYTTHAATTDLV
jgi:hypothetical protein